MNLARGPIGCTTGWYSWFILVLFQLLVSLHYWNMHFSWITIDPVGVVGPTENVNPGSMRQWSNFSDGDCRICMMKKERYSQKDVTGWQTERQRQSDDVSKYNRGSKEGHGAVIQNRYIEMCWCLIAIQTRQSSELISTWNMCISLIKHQWTHFPRGLNFCRD